VSPHALAGSEGVLEVYSALEKKKKKKKKKPYKYKLYYKYKLSPLFPYAAIIDMIFTLDLCMTRGEM